MEDQKTPLSDVVEEEEDEVLDWKGKLFKVGDEK